MTNIITERLQLCSKKLKTDQLCQHIENKLNEYLEKCELNKKPTEITVRCLSSKSCNYKFEDFLSNFFNDKKTHSCTKKLIAAIATIEDKEIMSKAIKNQKDKRRHAED